MTREVRMELDAQYVLTTPEQLSEHYAPPSERVIRKQVDRIDTHARAFIAASPFLILTTAGPAGVDCSPREDAPGFVAVADAHTLLIPDRRGNNRIDSLQNIIANPAVGLIFLVPGVNETFRVNGRATISTDPALRARFEMKGALPATVLVVQVEEAFIQCARALLRSELWNPERHLSRDALPSIGTILETHTGGLVRGAEYDAEAPARLSQTLY